MVNQHSDLKLWEFKFKFEVVIRWTDVICNHYQTRKYKYETSKMCCSNGKVKLLPLYEFPLLLLSYLYTSTQNLIMWHHLTRHVLWVKVVLCLLLRYNVKFTIKMDYFIPFLMNKGSSMSLCECPHPRGESSNHTLHFRQSFHRYV